MKKVVSLLLSFLLLVAIVPIGNINAKAAGLERYTVLLLDASGSMWGTPNSVLKSAAKKFCSSMLESSGVNKIALVPYESDVYTYYDFTDNLDELNEHIDSLYASGGTNIYSAEAKAIELLSDVDDSAIKNIVLLTDGCPESGTYQSDGIYNDDIYYAPYANAVYGLVQSHFQDYYFYTLGFFHSLYGEELEFARKFLNDIQNSGYYDVTNVDELEFAFGEVAEDIVNDLKKLSFTYQSGKDYRADCYYTNDYFAKSSYTYNPSLATMSIAFAMSAFGSADGGQDNYKNKSKNARKLLEDIGVSPEKIKTNDWFTKKPTTDSIGVVTGSMPISVEGKKYTLIAVAVRGGGYESEWASNFTIGKSGQHSGFDTAKKNVINHLKQYIAEQNITGDVKFWITGYSRAAATANLVSGAIDDGTVLSSNITYANEDVYAYCFETPAGALTSNVNGKAKYNNIFNIINPSDPVPYVAPAAMGFGRYGIDHYLPSKESSSDYSSKKEKMLKIYKSLDSTSDYIVDDFQMKKLEVKNWLPGGKKISFIQDDKKNNFSQGLFLSNYVNILAKDFIKNRSNYVSQYQDEIREILSVVFGCTEEQSKKLMESIVVQAKEEWGDLAWSYAWNTGINPWGNEDDAFQIISNWLKKGIKDAGITNYDESTIDAAGKDLADLFLALAANHPNYLTTAVMNGSGLGAAHYPELCFSWVASMDNNYYSGANISMTNGGYRIIRINCDVDVKVRDNSGSLVVEIINETPKEDSQYVSGIDENGQKYVVLPIDEDFHVEVTARADDVVNYNISEYSTLAGDYNRVVNYYDISLSKGETLKGSLPSYSEEKIEQSSLEGSGVNYTLKAPDGSNIQVASDLSGNEAGNAYFAINAVSSNDAYGIVTGRTIQQIGQFVNVEAIPYEGYNFEGWFIDDVCVSTETTYRVKVEKEITIVGRFVPGNISGDVNSDGIVNGKDSTRLLQYLAGWDVVINEAAADCNGDGTVDGKDSIRLLQYLAGWDVKLG